MWQRAVRVIVYKLSTLYCLSRVHSHAQVLLNFRITKYFLKLQCIRPYCNLCFSYEIYVSPSIYSPWIRLHYVALCYSNASVFKTNWYIVHTYFVNMYIWMCVLCVYILFSTISRYARSCSCFSLLAFVVPLTLYAIR